MPSVTFETDVGGDGTTVTDDGNATTGLAQDGHRLRFVPALSQFVTVADWVRVKALQTNSDASASAASSNSASGFADNSSASAGASEVSNLASGVSETNSADSASLSEEWANNPQDVAVTGTSDFSARHWAAVAQTTATGNLIYRGSHDASGDAAPSETPALGDYYKISVAGSFSGHDFNVGDSAIYNDTDWDKIDSTDGVATVAGRTGAVVLGSADITDFADAVKGVTDPKYLRSDEADVVAGKLTYSTGLARSAHNSGHLEGGHNNVGASDVKTNPIYTIGSGFNPEGESLDSMYGIGFTKIDASFIDFTGATGWGMYVCENGTARVWLDGSSGNICGKGDVFAAGATFDGGINTTVDIVSDDTGKSELRLYGTGGGTGRVFIGQAANVGGGIQYHGDNTPASPEGGNDYTTLFRRSSDVDYWTARNYIDDNDWEFRATVTCVTLVETSARKKKKDIEPSHYGLAEINLLEPVKYIMKDSGRADVGLIGDDAIRIMPEFVSVDADGNVVGIAYSRLTVPLIASVKELSTNFDTIYERVAELSAEVSDLKKQLQGLSGLVVVVEELKAQVAKLSA
jgi:hypothetical protein